jgi:hypothetical protein
LELKLFVSKYHAMSLLQDIQVIIHLLIQTIIIFPYSALTIPRQRKLLKPQSSCASASSTREPAIMISDKVHDLCTSKESVSTILAVNPTLPPGEAWKKLYGGHAAGPKESKTTSTERRDQATPADLQRAFECGNWGPTKPSELFLRVRTHVLYL